MNNQTKTHIHSPDLANTERTANHIKIEFHGPAFSGLETTKRLNEESIEAEARALLDQLTLDEKIKMMSGDTPFWPGLNEMFGGGYGNHPWVAGAVPRLGIPGIRFVDGPRGVMLEGATTFPVSMARGAAFDPELEERVGDVIGKEIRAMGGNFFGGVCINLLRHPAWGRAQETYGEDPYHLGKLGAALVRGAQRHVMACTKHYALNSMENARFSLDVTVGERALYEVYLRHFKRVVDEGVASVMSAYNSVNGEWCGQNYTLLTKILKGGWGFQGFVMTDFIFGMRDSKIAVLAGQDVEMPFAMIHTQHLKKLVKKGDVPLARIDDSVLRILRQQVRFAQGRDPKDYPLEVVGCKAHTRVAREVAEKSIVLLKNEALPGRNESLLPLRGVQKLAVIGKLAATPNTGDGGSSDTRPAYVITPLQGLQEALDEQIDIVYEDGSDLTRAFEVARDADAVVMVVGYTHEDEGEYTTPDSLAELARNFPFPRVRDLPAAANLVWRTISNRPDPKAMPSGGDRKTLTLRPSDEELIQSVAAANPKLVVAMMGGSAIITENWRSQVPAILMLWYPGMEGGHAFADILLGKVNPSGKLPCTFPIRPEDLPYFDVNAKSITYDLWHGYRKLERDGTAPAFPFGYGLSFTKFVYTNLRLEMTNLTEQDSIVAELDVTNAGPAAGETVVQSYITVLDSRVERAPKELRAFQRVSLESGETKGVRIKIPLGELAYYDPKAGWTVEATTYTLIVGQHSLDDQALQASFRVT